MRTVALFLAVFPFPAFADDYALSSNVSAVTMYPQGATVTREVSYTIPAGQHQLILTDLPRSTPLASVRVQVTGAKMGSVTARNDFVPPRSDEETEALAAARAEVERLEAALRQAEGGIEAIRLEAEAAKARVAFLEKLGEGDGVTELEVSTLRDLSSMIGEETLSALQDAHEAGRRAEEATLALKDLNEELEDARKALAALVPEDEDRAMLAVAVSADTETRGTLTVTYNTRDAGWQPVYDIRLARDTGVLRLERGAYVAQYTGENWENAALTLSTVRPSEQTAPSDVWPWLRRIYESDLQPRSAVQSLEVFADQAEGRVAAEPVAVEEAEANFDGLSVTYAYPGTVSVASGADRVRLALGELETEADLIAQAVPLSDQTAFLMAEFTNDMGELLLPTVEASFYLDGRFVGQRSLQLVAAGAEAELSFGPIDGLRLTRTVLDRNKGDRGVITRSNELTEDVRIEVENLTGEDWPLRLIDRVPYSEQEDLDITWQAQPRPVETDLDGKRGVMAWTFDVPAGGTQTVTLSHTIEWPEGMFLQ